MYSTSYIQGLTVQGRNYGGKGEQFPGRRIIMGAPNHYGGAKYLLGAPNSPNNFTITSFNTVNFLPKDLRFEQWGAKHASCPGHSLTSLRPCYSFLFTLTIAFICNI